MASCKVKLGRLQWFETGRVNIYVRKPANLGKAYQLFCNGFSFTGLLTDFKIIEEVLASIRFKGAHHVFDTKQQLHRCVIDLFGKSIGIVAKVGDPRVFVSLEKLFGYDRNDDNRLYWLVAMFRREKVEEILVKAGEQERDYEWIKAARLLKQALSTIGKRDFLKKGQICERIGSCSFRTAMQAQSLDEFRDEMLQAVANYEKAHGFYQRLTKEQKNARIFRCDAVARYLCSWLTLDPSERRRLLDECLGLEARALQSFSESGETLEYGITYSEIPLVFWDRTELEWSGEARKKICERGMEWGERAVAALSESDALHELARSYFTYSTCLGAMRDFIGEPKKKEKNELEIIQYARRAVDLSRRTGDLLTLGLADLWLGDTLSLEENSTKAEEALKCGEMTRDNRLIAWSLGLKAYLTFWKAFTEEDLEKWKELMEETLRVHDRIHRICSSLPIPSKGWALMDFPFGYLAYYSAMAEREPVIEKRLGLLKKAEKAGAEALRLAESSDRPSFTHMTYALLSWLSEHRAQVGSDPAEKKRHLEMALKLKEKVIQIRGQVFPFDFWDNGVAQTTLAKNKMDLADIESDIKTKQKLLEEALSSMEEGLKLLSTSVPYYEKIGYTHLCVVLRRDHNRHATLLTRLYDLSKKPEYLRKAIEASQKAIDAAEKLDHESLKAESHWIIAKMQDTLGEHLKAAENFKQASESYGKSSEKIPQLTGFYSDCALYMRAWAEIEKSRHEREKENYKKSGEHYQGCSRLLEMTKKWSYLSLYYLAWSLLDHGEALSRLDKPQRAIEAFNEAGRTFGDSAKSLRAKGAELENSEERDEAAKLANVAGLRSRYCMGRVLMEEAALSSRKGGRILGASKYTSAAGIFKEIAPNLEREEAREDLRFAAAVCEAWEKMELAEERGDAALYGEAACLFSKASEMSRRKTARMTAMGNSCFCEALEIGMKFMATSNIDFYSRAKLRMENAAGYYQRAGFEKPALWVEATKRLFDAYVYVGKAEAETEPEKRVKFFLMAEKCLKLSANFFGKAGYRGRKNEVLRSLERTRRERELAFSLNEVFTAPAILSSAVGVSMPDLTEKAAGLNGFESVNIRASVSAPREFVPSEEFEIKLDLVNVGKRPGILVRVEGLVPLGCEALRVPSYCAVEGASLNMNSRRLDPLSVESVGVWVQIVDVTGVRLSPNVVYVDELGNFKTTKVEEVDILPVVRFESWVAQATFNYLVNAFVEDRVKRRFGLDKSGWRSFPQILKGARVPKRSLYGTGGRLGHGMSELHRKGLVDLKTLLGERGRGGHILMVRIYHSKELVKRYVNEKVPNLLI